MILWFLNYEILKQSKTESVIKMNYNKKKIFKNSTKKTDGTWYTTEKV